MSRISSIAKNTAFLYIRMLLIMVIQFYTVRITLKYLGVEDYGIYNVVCGVTNIFTFLTHTMTSASQRFLAFDIGKKDWGQLKRTFDTLVALFSICGLVGVILLGVIGYWFIITHLIIPVDRIDAAIFAFYFTLLSLFVSIYVLPYNSLIIAHEDMKAFAYVSIMDASLKLVIVYCLVIIPIDKLKLYSLLMFFAYLIPSAIYIIYCFRKYHEVQLSRNIEWKLTKKIVPFMSWNLLGGLSWMLCTQGLSIVINMFFGPVANAAKAISDKVNSSVNGFVNNFMMAAQPQIVKTYSVGNVQAMHEVIFMTSKMSFYLMLILALPIVVNADGLLRIWLSDHDKLTTIMLQCVLLFSFLSSLENPINQAIRATGNIRNYQIYIGFITLLVIPLSYAFFKLGLPAYYGYIALIIVYGVAFISRLYYLKKQVAISYREYFYKIIYKCGLCFLVDIFIVIPIVIYGKNVNSIILWIICVLLSALIVFLIGLTKNEKKVIYSFVSKLKHRNHEN